MDTTITIVDDDLGNQHINSTAVKLAYNDGAISNFFCDISDNPVPHDRIAVKFKTTEAALSPAHDDLIELTGTKRFDGLKVFINRAGGYKRVMSDGTGAKILLDAINGVPQIVTVSEDVTAVNTAINTP